MRLNARGVALMGQGQTTVSVQKVPKLPNAGIGGWIDDAHFVANALLPAEPGRPAGWYVVQYDALLNRVSPLVRGGANTLVAGGGRWLGWTPSGMFGTPVARPAEMRKADVRGAGLDGTLAWCRDQVSGIGLVLTAPDLSVVEVPSAVAFDVHVLGPGMAVWFDGQTVYSVGISVRPALPSGKMRVAFVDNETWLVYWSEGIGLIAQLNGSADGYILETRPIAFNHDAVGVGSDLVVAWSTTQGEGPGDLIWQIVDRTLPRARLLPPIVVPKIGRPCWLGWFNFKQGDAGPGNCTLAVRNIVGDQGRPTIISDETEEDVTGVHLGHFIGGGSVESIEVQAKQVKDRPIVYWDDNRWPRYPTLPKGAWTCIRAYCPKGRSLAVFEVDMREILRAAPGPLALVGQQYVQTPVNTLVDDLPGLVPVLLRLARDFPAIQAVLLFSGYGRAGGLQDHPELVSIWSRVASETDVPKVEPWPARVPAIDPPPAPERYKKLKHYRLGGNMTERGYLVGAGKKYVKGDASKPGIFDGTFFAGAVNDGKEDSGEFEARQRSDGRFNLFHVQSGMPLEMDATSFSAALDKQYYLKPGDGESAYSIFEGRVEDPGGVVMFYKKFDNEQPVNIAAAVVWVKK